MDNMLRRALREFLGLLKQLLTNLFGEDGETWAKEFKKFLRKEPCWPKKEIASAGAPKKTAVEKCRSFFQAWLKELDIEVEVSLPQVNGRPVSNKEIRDRCKNDWILCFWPGGGKEMYRRIMKAMGQADHWTCQGKGIDADNIKWDEKAKNPYWFWAEVMKECPRLKKSRNDLMTEFPLDSKQYLLSLEEYCILFFAYRREKSDFFDKETWCWLRTAFGSACAFGADCLVSRLSVRRLDFLDYSYGDVGGRLAEILL